MKFKEVLEARRERPAKNTKEEWIRRILALLAKLKRRGAR